MLKYIIIVSILVILLLIILCSIYFKNVSKIQEELGAQIITVTDATGNKVDVNLHSSDDIDGGGGNNEINTSGNILDAQKPKKPHPLDVFGWNSYINKNYANYKCNPLVMPFVGTLFGPPGSNSSSNYAACEASKTLSAHKMLNMSNMSHFNSLNNLTAGLSNDINKARQMTNYMRNSLKSDLDEAYSKVKENWQRVMQLYQNLRKILHDLSGIFSDSIDSAIYAMNLGFGIMNNPTLHFFGKL